MEIEFSELLYGDGDGAGAGDGAEVVLYARQMLYFWATPPA